MCKTLKQNRKELKPMIVMFKAYHSLIEVIKEDIKDTGFDFNEFTVLEVVYHKKRLTVADIKDKVLVVSSSLTYILDKLTKKNLIRRVKCTDDRRVTYVELTEEGLKRSKEVFPKHYDNLKEIFKVLTEDEKTNMTDILKKVGFSAIKLQEENEWYIYILITIVKIH